MRISAPKDLSECRRFFLEPRNPKQRIYEALRAYFVDNRPRKEVACDFGYSVGSYHVLCHHFRRDPAPVFFVSPHHGPQSQPKKSAARDLIISLRKQNYSVYEISQTLKVTVRIGPAIASAGHKPEAINALAEKWIESQQKTLDA